MDAFVRLNEYTEQIRQTIAASAAALCIIKDNKIIHEWYSGSHHFHQGARPVDKYSQFNVYSTRAVYVGLAAAMAIDDGSIEGLDSPIQKYMPAYDADVLGDTTIRHLVTRTTGLQFQGNEVARRFEAGTSFEGKKLEVLAAIIRQATGQSVAEMLTERVFKPLGFTHTGWMTHGKETLVCDIHDPQSHPVLRLESDEGGDRNLYVSARELAYWGLLHLNRGEVGGRQIVPQQVFDMATTVQTPSGLPAHLPRLGFYWWIRDQQAAQSEISPCLPGQTYQILGASGCSCTVIPRYNAVAVRMTNSLWTYGGKNGFDYLADIHQFGRMVEEAVSGD